MRSSKKKGGKMGDLSQNKGNHKKKFLLKKKAHSGAQWNKGERGNERRSYCGREKERRRGNI